MTFPKYICCLLQNVCYFVLRIMANKILVLNLLLSCLCRLFILLVLQLIYFYSAFDTCIVFLNVYKFVFIFVGWTGVGFCFWTGMCLFPSSLSGGIGWEFGGFRDQSLIPHELKGPGRCSGPMAVQQDTHYLLYPTSINADGHWTLPHSCGTGYPENPNITPRPSHPLKPQEGGGVFKNGFYIHPSVQNGN